MRFAEYIIMMLIFAVFVRDVLSDAVPARAPEQAIQVNLAVWDSGVEVLRFDNATLLPSPDCGISFTHMGTEYRYTGTMLIEIKEKR